MLIFSPRAKLTQECGDSCGLKDIQCFSVLQASEDQSQVKGVKYRLTLTRNILLIGLSKMHIFLSFDKVKKIYFLRNPVYHRTLSRNWRVSAKSSTVPCEETHITHISSAAELS